MSSGLFGLPNPLQALRTMALSVTGKPGAVAGAGLAGGTTSGAPTTGAFSLGDAVVDQTGQLWICTVAGSPGTWVATGASASNITAGTLAQARGGTGIDTSAATNGQLLIGKTSDHTLNLATLTAGNNVTITNSAGGITIAATPPMQVMPFGTAAQSGAVGAGSAITKAFLATSGGTAYSDITAAINGGAPGATLSYAATNDSVYIGSTSAASGMFPIAKFTSNVAAVWTATFAWEYFNGSAWVAFPSANNLKDGTLVTTPWQQTGNVTFFPPSDWATTAVNGTTAWWIRCRCTAFTSSTTSPKANSGLLSRFADWTSPAITMPATGTMTKFVNLTAALDYGLYNVTANTYSIIQSSGAGGSQTTSIPVTVGDLIIVFHVGSTGTLSTLTTASGYLTPS